MTIASLFLALIATTAADAPSGDPVLLDFHASWCGPCQTMRPVVSGLVRNKYPVKSIDIDRSPELARRYGVDVVPTFVVVDADGKPLAKTKGAMSAASLAKFYNDAAANVIPPDEAEGRDDPASTLEAVPEQAEESEAPALVNPKPWETVVRIKMHLSDREWGYGSGTIIHSTPEESIILTCAHIFRVKEREQPQPKNFRVPISVDLFDGTMVTRQPAMIRCVEKDVPGQAIDYDFVNDVGLIRIKPGRKLASSRVVPPYWKPQVGMKMFAVGCSHGADATAWSTKILNPKITMTNNETHQSFSEMMCQFQPKEGRSGGGLYTQDGYVAGVCDFADPQQRVGLYAVPEAIHKMLDKNLMMAYYRPGTERPGTRLAGNTTSRPSPASNIRFQSPSEPEPGSIRTAQANDITIPSPEMLGIKTPRGGSVADPGPRTWQPNQPVLARSGRPAARRAESEMAIDDGPAPAGPVTAGLGMEPNSESQAFDDLEARTPRRPAPSAPAIRANIPGTWHPVRNQGTRPAADSPAGR